ncbi:hypothetical protein YC2023_078979 [Brassica napus]
MSLKNKKWILCLKFGILQQNQFVAAFMCYGSLIIGAAVFLIIRFCPQYGQANVMVYSGICSLVGSLSVMNVKALGTTL